MQKSLATTATEAINTLEGYDFRTVAFDVETKGLEYTERWAHGGSYEEGNPTGISFYNGQHAVYIDTCGWSDDEMGRLTDFLKSEFEGSFKGRQRTYICHNIPFDMSCAYKYGLKLWSGEWFCTLTASHLLDENRRRGGGGHGLKSLAQDLLDVDEVVDWETARFDKELFREYAFNDSIWTFRLAQRFSKEMTHEGKLMKLFRKIEMPFQRVLLQMDVNGVPVDAEQASKVDERVEKRLAQLEIQMLEMLDEDYEAADEDEPTQVKSEFNVNSNMQVAPRLIEDFGIELTVTTKTGNWSLAGDVVDELIEKYPECEFLSLFKEFKQYKHLHSHFIKKIPRLVEEDGRMRPNWKNTGTVTGRLSSSQPNFQNLPNAYKDPVGIREFVKAEDGKMLVAADYSGQENCILAHVSGDERLVSMIKNRQDLHLSVANEFMDLGIPEEKLKKDHPDFKHLKEEKYATERKKSKVITFGLAYGKTPFGFAQDFGITEEEGQQILDDYFERFPGVEDAMERAHAMAEELGYVEQHFGRRRRFPRNKWGRQDKSALRQAFNFMIQSPAADMIRIAAVNAIKRASQHPEWEMKIIMQVHDEIVVECDEEHTEAVGEALRESFEDVGKYFTVPFEADITYGKTYQECK